MAGINGITSSAYDEFTRQQREIISAATSSQIRSMAKAMSAQTAPAIEQALRMHHQPFLGAALKIANQSASNAAVDSALRAAGKSVSSHFAAQLKVSGVVEALTQSFMTSVAPSVSALDNFNFQSPAYSMLSKQLFGSEVIGVTIGMLRTGEIDYDEVVEGVEDREHLEQTASSALAPDCVRFPSESEMDLQRVAVLLYLLMTYLIIFEIGTEHPGIATVSLAALNGGAVQVARNLGPAPAAPDPDQG